MARGFASFSIAAASILTVLGSVPALAQLNWDSATAPIQYLQYDLPYYKLAQGSFPKYQYSRPKPGVTLGRLGGLYDYAPHAVGKAAPMVGAWPVAYIGYDLTPYYNLAPGCPLGNPPGHTTNIC
jgi:hypothetical protein